VVDDRDESVEEHEERRGHDRSRLIVDVFFDGQDATGVASTKDFSVGGFFMSTKADLPKGALLMVRIPLHNGKQVVANAEVVYSNPANGVGLRFRDLSEQNKALIEEELGHG
jgi:hypothetical protein